MSQGREVCDWCEAIAKETEAHVVETLQIGEDRAIRIGGVVALKEQVGPVFGKNPVASLEHIEFMSLDIAFDEGNRTIGMFSEMVIKSCDLCTDQVASAVILSAPSEARAAPEVFRSMQREFASRGGEPRLDDLQPIQRKVTAKFVEMNGQFGLRLEGNHAAFRTDATRHPVREYALIGTDIDGGTAA